jgi:hypothetical protein
MEIRWLLMPTKFMTRVSHQLANDVDQLIRDDVVTDQAELARLGHVSRARLTQIMNLLSLAPDIQEAILFLPTFDRGRNQFTEKQLRPIAAVPDWRKQRMAWRLLRTDGPREPDRALTASNYLGSTAGMSVFGTGLGSVDGIS